jgi:hypothetical protein
MLLLSGCDRGPQLAPVRGKVLFDGKPLEFGSVMFQPKSGQPARSEIRPDGTFELTTIRQGDGAVVGANHVRVTCWEGQRPAAPGAGQDAEAALGASLIPKKYMSFEHSGITIEVKPEGHDALVIELTSD